MAASDGGLTGGRFCCNFCRGVEDSQEVILCLKPLKDLGREAGKCQSNFVLCTKHCGIWHALNARAISRALHVLHEVKTHKPVLCIDASHLRHLSMNDQTFRPDLVFQHFEVLN